MFLLMDYIPSLSEKDKGMLQDMTTFISIFYAEWFLRAEITVISPAQDIKALWQMRRFETYNPTAAQTTAESILQHHWYFDPPVGVL